MNKIITFILAMLCCAVLLTACGGEGSEGTVSTTAPAGNDGYRVSVTDALGNPCSGVIVRFMTNGEQVSMQVTGENGVAEKSLDKGSYTVELAFTDSNAAYYYDRSDLSLSADKMELQIILAKAVSEKSTQLFAQGKDQNAYAVDTGCTYVPLVEGERSYFLFTPTQAGKYRFSVSGGEASIGYYGHHHFVQSQSAVDAVDNAITMDIKQDMIGEDAKPVLVIGLDAAAGVKNTTLCIARIGEPSWGVEDEPWQEYTAQTPAQPYTLTMEATQKLTYVDITAATDTYKLVYNEADGFYHIGSADGAVMLVHLARGVNGTAPYISFEEMLGDGTPDSGYTALRRYFFDEKGEFVKKEDYTNCMISYIVNVDKTYGVYPLTKDLEYMIRNGGEQQGWWNVKGHSYLFGGNVGEALVGVNPEISWMFACCYAE